CVVRERPDWLALLVYLDASLPIVDHEWRAHASTTYGRRRDCSSVHHVNKQEQGYPAPAIAPLGLQEQITQALAYLQLLHQEQSTSAQPIEDRLCDILSRLKKAGSTSTPLLSWRGEQRSPGATAPVALADCTGETSPCATCGT